MDADICSQAGIFEKYYIKLEHFDATQVFDAGKHSVILPHFVSITITLHTKTMKPGHGTCLKREAWYLVSEPKLLQILKSCAVDDNTFFRGMVLNVQSEVQQGRPIHGAYGAGVEVGTNKSRYRDAY
ncbi:unnamed protein product [Urochloa humidicola]